MRGNAVFIEFTTNNAAFDGGEGQHEVARILRNIATKIEAIAPLHGRIEDSGAISDINGNHVGRWTIRLPKQED